MKKHGLIFLMSLCCALNSYGDAKEKQFLIDNFKNPPADTKPAIYWYWMNEHVSKDGITKDLEAMSRVGIGEVYIGNIYEGGVPGKIETLSEEWKDCMRHAIKEGTRLGVDVSLFNSPGWSQSGGPWVKQEEAMRYLAYESKTVDGGSLVKYELDLPYEDFQDVALLAYPKMKEENRLIPEKVSANFAMDEMKNLFDGDVTNKCVFKNNRYDSIVIDIDAGKRFSARSLVIYPTSIGFNTTCKLLRKSGNEYKLVKQMFFDRSNVSLQLGPTPDGPLSMAFPCESSEEFRIVLDNLPANFELREIKLSSSAKLEKFTEKWLNKLPNTSTPGWNAYVWSSEAVSDQTDFAGSEDVIDLSRYVKNNVLEWYAPKGEWNIIRVGMRPTGTTNVPAAPKARGLEIDKMNKDVCKAHFDAFVGDLLDGMDKKDIKSVKKLIVDSYEVGPQNWSDNFRRDFISSMGYDPVPWLPVISGDIIGSEEESNRFLWDMRRTIADQIAEQYVGGLKEVANKNGLKLWLENYGHWGYPSEFLYYGRFSDYVGGEFWAGSGPGPECKLASSACHIYGKNKVYAESYTCGGNYFGRTPEELKQKGDWSYTQGVNQVVMHVYIHQPYEERNPGINAWFGIEYNRKNTWFEQSKSWIDYQRRCCFMLQQGVPVNDLCIFIGENAPSMDGWRDKELSNGYSFDFINADVILNRLSVRNGKLRLPEGTEYSAMLLPPLTTMRPQVLKKIEKLVKDGAVIIGTPPVKSPSLSGYPHCDEEVKNIAGNIWGNWKNDGSAPLMRKVGKGAVYCNVPVNDVLAQINTPEDVKTDAESLGWTHRRLKNGDIYFLTNQGGKPIETNVSFRVKNKRPELWNAVDGSLRPLESYINEQSYTTVPIKLGLSESCFIVFVEDGQSVDGRLSMLDNYPVDNTVFAIDGPWNISFENKGLNQIFSVSSDSLFDWTQSDDSRIKYFSGKAVYKTTFDFGDLESGQTYSLSFDNVFSIATIKLNGKNVGALWTKPYKIDITEFLKKGNNELEIEVSNTWVNQLIHQARLNAEDRTTWTLIDVIKPDQPLVHSGIWGNISIVKTQF